ncbi:TPA: hypothetical protein HA278_07010 [Candidatus Woesearchaeota archaeon]|nr:hypothetical protein [Candidatus Woesearchaeota archaeon]|tara:strand:+ start:259 stop:513 length:255 start_codon:yes stop_codon:yes gene_type:complete
MKNWRKATKDFILNERRKPDAKYYIQALAETLESLRPRSQTDRGRIEVAKQHVTEIRRHLRRAESKVQQLEEELNILREEKDKK